MLISYNDNVHILMKIRKAMFMFVLLGKWYIHDEEILLDITIKYNVDTLAAVLECCAPECSFLTFLITRRVVVDIDDLFQDGSKRVKNVKNAF